MAEKEDQDEAREPGEGPNPDHVVAPFEPSDVVAGDVSDPSEGENTEKKSSVVSSFLKVSGYERSDIAAFNAARRTVVTKNGGKYVVSKSGRQIKHLAGPLPPSVEE